MDKPTRPPISVDASLIESMRLWGAPDEQIEAVQAEHLEAQRQAEEATTCQIYADCWDSVMLFLQVQTQWIWAGGGLGSARRVGLNREAVSAEMRMRGIPRSRWPELLEDLRVIELAVLEADAERAET